MKTILMLLTVLVIAGYHSNAQKLSDFYKKEIINLEPVSDFGTKNNWDTLFSDYNTSGFGKPIGQMRNIVVAPDGSIFMSHKTRHEIWKFDKNGNFVLKFGRQGGKPGQFVYLPTVQGILDGKYIYTSDVQGRINFFDFNGKFIKMLKLDYMPLGTVPLKGGKIAILGFAVGTKSPYIVQIKDFNTGIEKQILAGTNTSSSDLNYVKIRFPNNDNYKPNQKKFPPSNGGITFYSPYKSSTLFYPRIGTSKTGNLIIAMPKNGEVQEYTPTGLLINSFKLNIKPLQINAEDIQKSYENAIKTADKFAQKYKESENGKNMTEQEFKAIKDSFHEKLVKFKDPDFYPQNLPYFSNMLVDSDGNILIFEYTKDEDNINNRFRAYSYDMKGNFLGTSSFKADNLELSFNPLNFQFSNGYVYSLVKTKQNTKVPLRIVKLKLE